MKATEKYTLSSDVENIAFLMVFSFKNKFLKIAFSNWYNGNFTSKKINKCSLNLKSAQNLICTFIAHQLRLFLC